MPKKKTKSPRGRTPAFAKQLDRQKAIQTRSSKIVELQTDEEAPLDFRDRAQVLHEASKEQAKSPALAIIRKVQAGRSLTKAEKEYEIASVEEMRGTLLPTLAWQYGRKQDRYVTKRSPESLDQQINGCLELLLKKKLSLADLPTDFDWCENNSIEIIYNEKDHDRFFPRLLDDLRNARQSIHIVTYGMQGKIDNEEDIAWQVAKILADKAAAGVEVNMILDGLGCGLTLIKHVDHAPAFIDWMKQRGINIVVNHPFRPADLQRFLRAEHRKLFVIDGEIGYCGGMGIENHFRGWLDVMLRLQGDIVNQMQINFLSTFHWQGGRVAIPSQKTNFKNELRQRYFPHFNFKAGNRKAKLLVNIPAPGRRVINESYINAFESTNESFYFMNPFFYTDWVQVKLQQLAENLFKKGHIWRPGMSTPSGVLAMLIYGGTMGFLKKYGLEGTYQALKRAGVGLLLYRYPLHAKLYVQDRMLSNIGTLNFDDASLERNWEMNIIIEGQEFADEVITTFFTNQEQHSDVKVESELQVSFVDWTKQKIADKLELLL